MRPAIIETTASILSKFYTTNKDHRVLLKVFQTGVLFFSRPQSEDWPHHGRTFSYQINFRMWLTEILTIQYLMSPLYFRKQDCIPSRAFLEVFYSSNELETGILWWSHEARVFHIRPAVNSDRYAVVRCSTSRGKLILQSSCILASL